MFLNKLALKTVEADEAFYFRNINGSFYGAVLTHVDDFEVHTLIKNLRELEGLIRLLWNDRIHWMM